MFLLQYKIRLVLILYLYTLDKFLLTWSNLLYIISVYEH